MENQANGITFDKNGGGGIRNNSCDITMANSLVFQNETDSYGGGILNSGGLFSISNSSFYYNNAYSSGDEIYEDGGSVDIRNSIIWMKYSSSNQLRNVSIDYSLVNGEFSGTGNINGSPQFVDVSSEDFHLKYISPAIDAGDNNSVIQGQPGFGQ